MPAAGPQRLLQLGVQQAQQRAVDGGGERAQRFGAQCYQVRALTEVDRAAEIFVVTLQRAAGLVLEVNFEGPVSAAGVAAHDLVNEPDRKFGVLAPERARTCSLVPR